MTFHTLSYPLDEQLDLVVARFRLETASAEMVGHYDGVRIVEPGCHGSKLSGIADERERGSKLVNQHRMGTMRVVGLAPVSVHAVGGIALFAGRAAHRRPQPVAQDSCSNAVCERAEGHLAGLVELVRLRDVREEGIGGGVGDVVGVCSGE